MRSYATITLLTLTVSMSSFCFAEIVKKYNFLTELELQEKYYSEVEPFFERRKVVGDFEGTEKIKIQYAKFVTENEKGAIVISNGRTESYLKYKELVYDLVGQGYSVYLYDHRGQGISERIIKDDNQKGHVDSFDYYVEDLNNFVNNIVLKDPHKKIFLLAHSMGGGIAVRYLEEYPSVFNAAALSSPMLAPNTTIPVIGSLWFRYTSSLGQESYAGFLAKPFFPTPFDTNEYTSSKIRYSIFLETYKKNKAIQLGGPTRGWAAQACEAAIKMQRDVGNIRTPILLLQSEHDTAVLPEAQEEFCENLKKKKGHSCYLDKPIKIYGAKHELFIEADEFRTLALTYIFDFYEKHL